MTSIDQTLRERREVNRQRQSPNSHSVVRDCSIERPIVLVPPISLSLQLRPFIRELPFLELPVPLLDLLPPLLLRPLCRRIAHYDDRVVLRRVCSIRVILFGGNEIFPRVLGGGTAAVVRVVPSTLEKTGDRLGYA